MFAAAVPFAVALAARDAPFVRRLVSLPRPVTLSTAGVVCGAGGSPTAPATPPRLADPLRTTFKQLGSLLRRQVRPEGQ